jgi:tetratricopeptide (TPR) repeat protein
MITIYSDKKQRVAIEKIIQSEYRLSELVTVKDWENAEPEPSAYVLIVRDEGIAQMRDWYNENPPYLLPDIMKFQPEVLLGIVFFLLENYEKTGYYLSIKHPDLYAETDAAQRLKIGIEIGKDFFETDPESDGEMYREAHNLAVCSHYGSVNLSYEDLKKQYQYALEKAINGEDRAFTGKHFALLLADWGEYEESEKLLEALLQTHISQHALIYLKNGQNRVWMELLSAPYDKVLLEKLKSQTWEVLQYFEKHDRKTDIALTLIDASQIANFADSFSESLGYINRAIDILKPENVPELLGNALLRKGTLLYTWAKNGNPQFYKGALETYQDTLKIFTRQTAPAVFAEIHHYLGVIYSEIPDEVKKRSIWAAVSSSSFEEALKFYNKTDFPYQYAMICSSFGNALTKYPLSMKTDNYEKALHFYNESLSIRTPEKYPYERALTLLNYLEASWEAGNVNEDFGRIRFQDMMDKVLEIKDLVADESLLAEAENHERKLYQLAENLKAEL